MGATDHNVTTRSRQDRCRTSHYRFVALFLGKHDNSVTLWLSKGLRLEQSDPSFKRRFDQLDARISADR